MIYANIGIKSRKVLQQLKGQRFVCYKFGDESFKEMIYGNVLLQFNKTVLEISNLERPLPFFDTEEELSCLSVKQLDNTDKFVPYIADLPTKTLYVDDIVTSVEIITDTININNGEYIVEFDEAIIIKTENASFMFAHTWHFSEIITIVTDTDYDTIYPIETVVENWSDDNENIVNVTRKIETL